MSETRLVRQIACQHGMYEVTLTHGIYHIYGGVWVKCEGSKEFVVERA